MASSFTCCRDRHALETQHRWIVRCPLQAVAQAVKNLPAMQETRVRSLDREDPLEKKLPTSVFLPGEFHGQRSLVGYTPWGGKEVDTAEWLTLSLFHTHSCSCSIRFWQKRTRKWTTLLSGSNSPATKMRGKHQNLNTDRNTKRPGD